MLNLDQLSLRHKRVIIRCDFNVPIEQGAIVSETRILACLPTIQAALDQEASVVLLSHLGQPKPGETDCRLSLAPVAQRLSAKLGRTVPLIQQWPMVAPSLRPGEIILAENTRFLNGETTNSRALAETMASQCDLFIMDAFASAHRSHASVLGLAQQAPMACTGLLFEQEVSALSKLFHTASNIRVAVLGGAKGDTKIELLQNLIPELDWLILGGGIANTFLAAQGYEIGRSIYNPDKIELAKSLIDLATQHHCKLLLPTDVITETGGIDQPKSIRSIAVEDSIVDIGPKTSAKIDEIIQEAETVVWNGPLGWFERPPFDQATQRLIKSLSNAQAFSLAGGGDTLAALEASNNNHAVSYRSTGGGAFLAFLNHKTLPVIEALNIQEQKFA